MTAERSPFLSCRETSLRFPRKLAIVALVWGVSFVVVGPVRAQDGYGGHSIRHNAYQRHGYTSREQVQDWRKQSEYAPVERNRLEYSRSEHAPRELNRMNHNPVGYAPRELNRLGSVRHYRSPR
jgi:hypothetical protein